MRLLELQARTAFLKAIAITVFVSTSLLVGTSANALTVVNHTSEDKVLQLNINNKIQEIVLEPSGQVSDVCSAGCILLVEDVDEMEVDGSETIYIEESGLEIVQ